MKLRFEAGALSEYEAAIRWYDEHSAVASAFVAAIEDAIARIRRAPRAFARWRGLDEQEIRRCVVRRFPFIVVYRVEKDWLTVVAVAHARREPGYWTRH